MKSWFKSKTLWMNIATLGLHYAKPFLGITTIPDVQPELLAVANIVLRLVTNKGLVVKEG